MSQKIVVVEIGFAAIRAGLAGRPSPQVVMAPPAALSTRQEYLELLAGLFVGSLQLRPKECQVLVVEKVSASRVERALLLSVLLKDLQVSAVTMQIDLCMSLLASGSQTMTGLVVDIGVRETRMISLAFGRPIQQSLRVVGIGVSHAVDAFIASIVSHLGISVGHEGETEVAQQQRLQGLKSLFEKVADAAANGEQDTVVVSPKQSLHGKAFSLPASLRRTAVVQTLVHGYTPVLGSASTRGGEEEEEGGVVTVLHPGGLVSAMVSCLSACNHDIRRACANNVVCIGGGAMIPNLAAELCAQATTAAAADGVLSSPLVPSDLAFATDSLAWTGASLFGKLKSSQARFITAAQFNADKPPPDWQSLDPDDWTFYSPLGV